MQNFDFIADYKTPEGWDMHQAFKVCAAGGVMVAASGVVQELERMGFWVISVGYAPGDRPLKELERVATNGPHVSDWRPVYLDSAAILEMAARMNRV